MQMVQVSYLRLTEAGESRGDAAVLGVCLADFDSAVGKFVMDINEVNRRISTRCSLALSLYAGCFWLLTMVVVGCYFELQMTRGTWQRPNEDL